MKKIFAAIIDFFIVFVGLGYLIAALTGQMTETGGFYLSGGSAFLLFALIIAYFVLCKKFLGQSLGRKIVGVEVKKKEEQPVTSQPQPVAESIPQPQPQSEPIPQPTPQPMPQSENQQI